MLPVGDLERNIPKNLIWAKGLGEIVDCQYCGWRHGLAKSSFGRRKRLLARHWQIDNSPTSIALLPSRMSHHGLGKLPTLCARSPVQRVAAALCTVTVRGEGHVLA